VSPVDWAQLRRLIAEHHEQMEKREQRECCGVPDCGWTMPTPCECETATCPEEGHGR